MLHEKVRVGVVGAGHAGNMHADYIFHNHKAQLVGICDLDEKKVKDLAAKYHTASYTDISEMIDKENPDIVNICTPPQSHCFLVSLAMDRNVNVLVEKPMSTSLDEADKMILKSKQTGKKMTVIHNDFFRPVMQKVKQMINDGELGSIVSINAMWGISPQYWWYEDWWVELKGGRFEENIPHALCLMLPFIGKVHSAKAYAKKIKNIEKLQGVDLFRFDEIQVIMDCDNSLASISMSMNSPGSPILYISGTKLSIRAELSYVMDEKITVVPVAGKTQPTRSLPAGMIGKLFNKSVSKANTVVFTKEREQFKRNGIYYEIDAYLDSILEDKAPPVTPEEGRELVRVNQLIWEAVESDIKR